MEKIPAINTNEVGKRGKVGMATDSNELRKGGKGTEKWWREEKVGMATDSDRLERAKHWDETADDR